MTGLWNRWQPTGLHAKRWMMLAAWIVVFSVLVAYALQSQRTESRRNDRRFCDVTSAFITSNLQVQNAQAKREVELIGLRNELIEADKTATAGILRSTQGQAAPSLYLTGAYLRAVFAAQTRLFRVSNISSNEVLSALLRADTTIRTLRRELRCG